MKQVHWWNPPYIIPVVEIIRGEKTKEEIRKAIAGILVQMSKINNKIIGKLKDCKL